MNRALTLTVLIAVGASAIAAVLRAQPRPETIQIEKVKDNLYYFGAGHTNGDTVIVFPAARTAVLGDLFARKWAPLIDAANGGSALAYPQTLAKVLTGVRNVDTVISGHATTTSGTGQQAT